MGQIKTVECRAKAGEPVVKEGYSVNVINGQFRIVCVCKKKNLRVAVLVERDNERRTLTKSALIVAGKCDRARMFQSWNQEMKFHT